MRSNLFTATALAAVTITTLAGPAGAHDWRHLPRHAVPLLAGESSGESSAPSAFGKWGFDLTGMDKQVKPGDGFFEFADGAWVARTTIPADKVSVGMFQVLDDRLQEQLRSIIEDTAKAATGSDSIEGKIGGLYAAFMDEARAEQLDASPIASDLAKIRAAKTKDDLVDLMGQANVGLGTSFFAVGVSEDEKNPTQHSLHASQSGQGLPDRDYYLQDTFKDKKAKYRDYAANMLQMIGWTDPQHSADALVGLETRIAEASWSKVEGRDVDKTYNPVSPSELAHDASGFPWTRFLTAAKVGQVERIVVAENTAFPKLAKIFAETPLETLQAWEAFHVADEAAPYLSKRFADARFNFYGKELGGQEEQKPRWKRGTALVDGMLGEALGQEYVRRYFPASSRVKMEELVGQLRLALRQRIENLPWMTPQTKAQALEKLSLFGVKIGYPKKWRDYSKLKIDAADLLGDIRRAGDFEWDYELAKLKRPVDPEEWDATPQTVNAYYNPTRNEIVFPAAILQAPFFDPEADMAVNYGGIGGVIGHEMTHGFDDQGRKSDGHGALTDWWQPADAAKFDAEAAKYGAQFDTYSVAPGVNVHGDLTMGENIADLGGILLALDAYHASLKGQTAPVLDGYTGEQRVFLGWAQVWRGKMRPEARVQQVMSDFHSPEQFRVDGPMRNVDAWYEAWGIKPGDKLYLKPEDRVRIW